jgi:hypothetical protein
LRHNQSNSLQFGLEKKKEKVYLSGIATNTSWVCSPPASATAAAAALIAANEPFFIGLFTATTFTASFLAYCLGMGGIFAAGQTDGGSMAHRPPDGQRRTPVPGERHASPSASFLHQRQLR